MAVKVVGAQGIDFPQVASPTYQRGRLVYDTTNECLTFFNSEADISHQLGQEHYIRVYNSTGATIANGAAVYINGFNAGSGLPTVALARADAIGTTYCIGAATHSIETGTIGYVCHIGMMRNIDTSAFTAGQILYLSATTAGAFTTTAPSGINYRVRLGVVLTVNASTGTVQLLDPKVLQVGKRVRTLTVSTNTYTPDADSTDLALITTPTANFSIAAPTGTPIDGQDLHFRIRSSTTGYTPTWNAAYGNSGVASLFTTALPVSKTVSFSFRYDLNASKWILMAADTVGY